MEMPETHLVTPENGARPGPEADRCLYCNQPMGAEHLTTCACRKRTIVVRMTIEYVVQTWAGDDAAESMDFRGEGSWCCNNALDEIARYHVEPHCLCDRASFEYVREADAKEHEEWLQLGREEKAAEEAEAPAAQEPGPLAEWPKLRLIEP